MSEMHYRWQCKAQRTNWLANDLTCSHCRCYVCNIALTACGVNSHKWAAPTAILNWEAKRPLQQAWTPLNEGAYELFCVQINVLGVNNQQMLLSTGLLTPNVMEYMSKPVPGNMWTFIKDSVLVATPDRIQHISSRETSNPLTYMGHNSYMNASQIRGNIYHTIQWLVEQKRLCVIGYIRATMWSFVVSYRFPVLGYGPLLQPSVLPDVAAFPRPLFPHQLSSLQDMLTVEHQSLHVRLWRQLHIPDVFAQSMQPNIDLDTYKRAFYVRQPGCVLPDSMIRGGLLQNDRGTGKTYIVASLICMNRAHDISHKLKLCPVVTVENEDDDRVNETTVPVITAIADETILVSVPQTLVVVPAANLIPQWVQELQMLDLKVIVHHGRTRVNEIADLADFDVVITTTDTLRCAWGSADSVFRKVKFWRAVFDECHKLLQGSSFTKAGIACVELHASHRWGLTATPDVTYSRSRLFAQLIAGPTTLELAENSIMHRFIQFPGRYSSNEGMHWPIYNSMVVLHDPGNNVLPAVHRNTYRIALENMPAYNEAVHRVRQIGTRRGGMYLMRVFNNMLGTINGNGPMRWPEYTQQTSEMGEVVEVPPDMYDCSICLDMMRRPVRSACNHFFCSNCIQHWLRTAQGCPLCRQPALPMMPCAEIADGTDEEDLSLLPSSAKAAFLVSRVESLLTTDANNEPNRILVFSRYLHMRNLLQTMLGSEVATSDINVFREQQKSVLIMSYVSGSVGLNLMEANHVILCEPCFRTSTEEQAIGRAARLGQRRVVNVHQVVMADTIEEIMLGVERDAKLSIQTVFGI